MLNFFQTAFEKIDRLSKLHLLVCPDSPIQYDESLVSPDFKKIKRVYELFSHGVTFWGPDQIRNAQLRNRAVENSAGNKDAWIDLSRDRVVHGELNAWRDWFRVALNMNPIPGLTEELREVRDKKRIGFSEVWRTWSKDTGKCFDDWYREERVALSGVLEKKLMQMLRRHLEIRLRRREISIEDLLPDHNETLVMDLKTILSGEDTDLEGFKLVWAFLRSDALDDVPFVRISSLIFASLARRARNGQNCPKAHPFNDVDAIAAYLPYCDAMFLDKEMESILRERLVRDRLGYPTRIFSLRNKTEFLDYLDMIETNAQAGHIEKVREVYGEDWAKPYTEVLHTHSS